MTRLDWSPPNGVAAGYTAVAVLAAMGATALLYAPTNIPLTTSALPLLAVVIAAGLLLAGWWLDGRARQEAVQDAGQDADTGLSTAAAAERVLQLEFGAAQRGRPLAVALIRLDQLHVYRVRHGKVVAGQLLRLAGRAVRKHRRSMHVAALQDEPGLYLSIMSDQDLDGACVYAAKVRRELMALSGLPAVPPISVGVATYDLSMRDARELLAQAERALEKGSASGGKVVAVGLGSTGP